MQTSVPDPHRVKADMVDRTWKGFVEQYNSDYRKEVNDIRKELNGRIQHLPAADALAEIAYTTDKPDPGDIVLQLKDLRALLNQVEQENNLPPSCQDIVFMVVPPDTLSHHN